MIRYLLLCGAALGLAVPSAAAVPLPALSPAGMAGESLVYDIAFLWFDRLAEGRFTFAPGDRPGTYRAELEAKTLGVAGWLTGERVQRYLSIMEEKDGRLRSLYHEAFILTVKGGRRLQRGKSYLFDYAKGAVRYQRLKDGKVTKEEYLPIDRSAPPKDVLTAFVGFRTGETGPLLPGRRYRIRTFSHKGGSEIEAETIADAERSRYPFSANGLLIRVRLDPEIFDTADGNVYIWIDEQGRPAAGIVENVVGLGNVRGTLR